MTHRTEAIGCTIRDIAKAAFYQTHSDLDRLLSKTYPNGCSLAEAIAWAKALPWKVEERNGEYALMYLCCVVQSGPQPTIDGNVVHNERPVGAWSGCRLVPKFDNRRAAERWAKDAGFNLISSTE